MPELWQRTESTGGLPRPTREDLAYWLEGRARDEGPEVARALKEIADELREGRLVAWSR